MTKSNSSLDAVVIERDFDAPVELVWEMWTDPQHFKAWYGPVGASIPVAQLDMWVGGIRRISMEVHTPNGPVRMWFTGEHRDIVEPVRLVYTESVCDEHGNVLAPTDVGMPEGHPVTTEVRVELEDLGGRTKMRMRHVGIPADSPGATGWAMAIDKLAAELEARTVR